MNTRFGVRSVQGLVSVLSVMLVLPAQATTWRTFVSPNGADTNDCSLAAPCRQFGAALAATTDGGEIVVLGSANYGHVSIDKSVTISTPRGVYAGISVFPAPANPNSAAILINAPNAKVVLKGLTFVGMGGDYGVNMIDGAALTMDGCSFSNFSQAGVRVYTAADVRVRESEFRDGYYGVDASHGASVLIANSYFYKNYVSAGAAGDTNLRTTSLAVERSVVKGGTYGFIAETITNGSATRLSVNNSSISGTIALGAGMYSGGAAQAAEGSISNSTFVGNGGTYGAIRAYGAGAKLVVSGNSVNFNSIGLNAVSGGVIETAGNNTLRNNSTPTAGTITAFSTM